jgi:hypothetical protein
MKRRNTKRERKERGEKVKRKRREGMRKGGESNGREK